MDYLHPEELRLTLVESYINLFSQFKTLIEKFLLLNVGESVRGENMCITCIDKGTDYVALYWNHFQIDEIHLIRVDVIGESLEIIDVSLISENYKLPTCNKTVSFLRRLPLSTLTEEYFSLYDVYSWLIQLK